ncbi:bone morphogenetic protein receptor type-2-like isoform X2 [Acanthopagrus latus]|uniref:bone morphogenetic protein receptor type-2-like isoform X2 n=1 Tax=Acanthopagrus latus TaxID=8177 RepID=UPI00187C64B1|nr:bone morphogenetic protein receptor type-2-like isoform X2 [Acanthopagrus latus]
MTDSVCTTRRCVAVGVILGNAGKSSHIPRADKHSLPAGSVWLHSDHDPATVVADFGCGMHLYMCLQSVFSSEETVCLPSDSPEQNIHNCWQSCDIAEKSCPDATCKAQMRFNGRVIKCVCNTDLCNSNITWPLKSEEPPLAYPYSGDDMVKTGVILFGALIILGLMITAAKRLSLFKERNEDPRSPDDSGVSPLCSCQATRSCEIDIADIELEQIVGHGNFATVWKGKYQGSVVAVKVFPAGWKHKFTAEKEIYELPLMKHAGIVRFLGTGRKPDGDNWLIVLQYAEYGTLHPFLRDNTSNWTSSLKLCQSLSQGLAYLHSDIRRHDVHKPYVAHRDLSSSNVLVKADGTCALCDFGCSTILRSSSGHCYRQNDTANMESHAQLGTLRYMSPEVLEGSVNLKNTWSLMQADMYALALLLWEIWMRCSDLFKVVPKRMLPYESELGASVTKESLILYVCHMEKRPEIPQHWELLPQGPELEEILTDSWDVEPDARLTAHCVADRLVALQSCYSI